MQLDNEIHANLTGTFSYQRAAYVEIPTHFDREVPVKFLAVSSGETEPTQTIKEKIMVTVKSVEAIIKMMEQAQQRNTQPQVIAKGANANGAATSSTPASPSIEAVLQVMEMAQKRNLYSWSQVSNTFCG